MDAPIGSWMRRRPSGYVHRVTGSASHGRRYLACGRWVGESQLTSDYPPLTRACVPCMGEDYEDKVRPWLP